MPRAPTKPRVRVVIADESAEIRALLRHTLDDDRRFEIVAEAGTAVEAAAVVGMHEPDAVVLDPDLPAPDGTQIISAILAAAPSTKIVLLTGYDSAVRPGEAVAIGAHAFLEKGVPHGELMSVLLSLCTVPQHPDTPGRPGGTPSGAPPAQPDATASADTRRRLAGDPAPMRRARWVGIVFTVVQFALYPPPPGTAPPFSLTLMGALVAVGLLLVNLGGIAADRRGDERLARLARFVGLATDTVLIVAIIWFFTFDNGSALWALLVLPVMEAALVAQMRGAMVTWAAGTVVYVARELWGASEYGHPFLVDSLTYRMGVILIVAVTIGQLASRLTQGMEAEQAARSEADARAALLRAVAASSRRISALTGGDVVATLVDSAIEVGFDAAEICVYDETSQTWSVRSLNGIPYEERVQPIDSGIAGVVHARGETVFIEDYALWSGALAEVRGAGLHPVVGVPILSSGELRGALIAGYYDQRPISRSAVECLELLAAQAGVAFGNIRLLEQIRHQALHDALTGIPNQLLFEDRVAQALARSRRENSSLGLLFVDLDRFKKVNDSLGHEAGNELLKQVAGRLLTAVRPSDTVARMGGDEFTILLPSLADEHEAQRAAQRILDEFRRPFVLGGLELVVTPSIGIGMNAGDGEYELMLRHADFAMYRAKQRGGNNAQLYRPELSHTTQATLSLEAELYAAFENGELRVLYQPVVDLATKQMVGVEALVRWQHPSLGLLAPDDFIPLAEESGLVVRIDTWVLEQALAQLSDWQARGLPPLRVGVNVSARQFFHPETIKKVSDTIRDSALDGSFIDLEVTEALAAENILDVVPMLQSLRGQGVSVAIDDFGTGYSMLSRLRQLPLDRLKIDKSFVQEIVSADDESPIVSATIAMAHSLGLTVVAEGVENSQQEKFLLRERCDFVQGYLFGGPMEACEIEPRLIAQGHRTA